ncbi:hypothetical protein CALCODRAFT_72762 [Calocera cornea HHB12733]|uniref:GPI transamidase component PIG-S n=1 Tax=Calocera cornea HHB12733 TaxID=1353952 RepID=A0A165ITG8_9BASI|nr:hypothetical protein CALCODRAFT_72762 [Calocera cornea HHB12733]
MAAVHTPLLEGEAKERGEDVLGLSLAHPVHEDSTRRAIVASYWIVVLLVFPVWYYMTSIERLPLPTERIDLLGQREVQFPIKIDVDLGDIGDLELSRTYPRKLVEDLARLRQGSSGELPPLAFDIAISAGEDPGDPCTDAASGEEEDSYRLHFRTQDAYPMFASCGRHLLIGARDGTDLPHSVGDTLRDLLAPYSNSRLHPPAAESRIAQYSPTYRLAFTLLNEDASVGGAAVGWEIQQALSQYIRPTLAQLSALHNFTIESQVQYFGGLTFDPLGPLSDDDGVESWRLSEEQMSVFVNSAEWTLTSGVSNDPVLHFILFVPSADRRPLYTETRLRLQRNDSFILPQWGGVVIHNPSGHHEGAPNTLLSAHDLAGPFKVFRSQLSALLGVPQFPPQVVTSAWQHKSPITPWQLDALKRRRALENVRNSADALRSIVSLVNQIENMPVGQDVLGQVDGALAALDATTPAASSSSLSQILAHSIDAFTLSSKAFFNPGMIGLLYYPTEHKYAVYTPLFAPVAVPLIVALVREIKAARERRRAAANKQKTE